MAPTFSQDGSQHFVASNLSILAASRCEMGKATPLNHSPACTCAHDTLCATRCARKMHSGSRCARKPTLLRAKTRPGFDSVTRMARFWRAQDQDESKRDSIFKTGRKWIWTTRGAARAHSVSSFAQCVKSLKFELPFFFSSRDCAHFPPVGGAHLGLQYASVCGFVSIEHTC